MDNQRDLQIAYVGQKSYEAYEAYRGDSTEYNRIVLNSLDRMYCGLILGDNSIEPYQIESDSSLVLDSIEMLHYPAKQSDVITVQNDIIMFERLTRSIGRIRQEMHEFSQDKEKVKALELELAKVQGKLNLMPSCLKDGILGEFPKSQKSPGRPKRGIQRRVNVVGLSQDSMFHKYWGSQQIKRVKVPEVACEFCQEFVCNC